MAEQPNESRGSDIDRQNRSVRGVSCKIIVFVVVVFGVPVYLFLQLNLAEKQLDFKHKEIENDKLKLENDKQKIENDKLKLEIAKQKIENDLKIAKMEDEKDARHVALRQKELSTQEQVAEDQRAMQQIVLEQRKQQDETELRKQKMEHEMEEKRLKSGLFEQLAVPTTDRITTTEEGWFGHKIITVSETSHIPLDRFRDQITAHIEDKSNKSDHNRFPSDEL